MQDKINKNMKRFHQKITKLDRKTVHVQYIKNKWRKSKYKTCIQH